MNQFTIVLLFVTASAEDAYNLSEGSNWRLRGLCSEFTPSEVRKSKEGQQWQLFAFDTQCSVTKVTLDDLLWENHLSTKHCLHCLNDLNCLLSQFV